MMAIIQEVDQKLGGVASVVFIFVLKLGRRR
jgi:hypothetical protein